MSALTQATPDGSRTSEATASRPAYVEVAQTAVSPVSRPNIKGQAVTGPTGHRQKVARLPPLAALSSSAAQNTNALDQLRDGYKVFNCRKRLPPTGVGTRKTAPVSAKPAKSALFFSMFFSSTTCEDLSELVSSKLQVGSFTCKKLRCKYDTSFHIGTTIDNFSRINDACAWPEGCLFRPS